MRSLLTEQLGRMIPAWKSKYIGCMRVICSLEKVFLEKFQRTMRLRRALATASDLE
jgi:hypothetical protein